MSALVQENELPMVVSILAHVATGALTLAVTIVLAILIRRHIAPKEQAAAGQPAKQV
jgi:hypothetical protein